MSGGRGSTPRCTDCLNSHYCYVDGAKPASLTAKMVLSLITLITLWLLETVIVIVVTDSVLQIPITATSLMPVLTIVVAARKTSMVTFK